MNYEGPRDVGKLRAYVSRCGVGQRSDGRGVLRRVGSPQTLAWGEKPEAGMVCELAPHRDPEDQAGQWGEPSGGRSASDRPGQEVSAGDCEVPPGTEVSAFPKRVDWSVSSWPRSLRGELGLPAASPREGPERCSTASLALARSRNARPKGSQVSQLLPHHFVWKGRDACLRWVRVCVWCMCV